MTYTHIALPQKKRSVHKLIRHLFLLISMLYIVGILSATHLSLENQNAQLNAKIYSFSGANSVSAPIVTPSLTQQQTSLIPVDETEVLGLLNKVNTLAILPEDESPTLATVVDITQFDEDSFFRNGANDDKLFVFQSAGIVVLYRPSEAKIVNMGMIEGLPGRVVTSPKQNASPEATMTAKNVTIGIYYVNETLESQKPLAEKLSPISHIEVAQEARTTNTNHQGISVIGLTDEGKGSIYKDVLKAVNGIEAIVLPDGEDISGVDIAIIVGE